MNVRMVSIKQEYLKLFLLSYLGLSIAVLHMDEQRQDDQLETIYSSSVPIRDVALETYYGR